MDKVFSKENKDIFPNIFQFLLVDEIKDFGLLSKYLNQSSKIYLGKYYDFFKKYKNKSGHELILIAMDTDYYILRYVLYNKPECYETNIIEQFEKSTKCSYEIFHMILNKYNIHFIKNNLYNELRIQKIIVNNIIIPGKYKFVEAYLNATCMYSYCYAQVHKSVIDTALLNNIIYVKMLINFYEKKYIKVRISKDIYNQFNQECINILKTSKNVILI